MAISVTTSGDPVGPVRLTATGLPAGLSFTDNGNGTGSITGTLAEGSSDDSPYTVTVRAQDAITSDTETFTFTVSVIVSNVTAVDMMVLTAKSGPSRVAVTGVQVLLFVLPATRMAVADMQIIVKKDGPSRIAATEAQVLIGS